MSPRASASSPRSRSGAMYVRLPTTVPCWVSFALPSNVAKPKSIEIWVCDSNGSNPVQLTSFGGPQVSGPRWSPDSQSIAFWAVVAGNPDAYVISANGGGAQRLTTEPGMEQSPYRSEEHTSELQSPTNLVCRLLLEKKKK